MTLALNSLIKSVFTLKSKCNRKNFYFLSSFIIRIISTSRSLITALQHVRETYLKRSRLDISLVAH